MGLWRGFKMVAQSAEQKADVLKFCSARIKKMRFAHKKFLTLIILSLSFLAFGICNIARKGNFMQNRKIWII